LPVYWKYVYQNDVIFDCDFLPMISSSKVQLAALGLISLLLFSCKKDNQFPDTPQITFLAFDQVKDISGKDSSGVLRFTFTDGDGDIGLTPADTFPPYNKGSIYYFNFFISYYEKQNGNWVKIVVPGFPPGSDTLSNNSRMPYITPEGQNKALEGEIQMSLFTNNPFSPFDTIKYEVTIADRALNRSNQITTREIVLEK